MMLFESRRILLGFRIKILFESSLRRENSYVFVNVSKTPTIENLLEDIRQRFEIKDSVYMTLNDCPLLESEDILVLTDVTEVKIVNKTNKNVNLSSLPIHERNDLLHNTVKCIPHQKKQNFSKTTETSSTDEFVMANSDIGVSEHSKKRGYRGSIAETIALLSRNCAERNEESISTTTSNNHMKNGSSEIEEQDVVDGEIHRINRRSLNESEDELTEKKKRKRKRKHSKKRKENSEIVERSITSQSMDFENVNEAPRQHIFFQDEDETKLEEPEKTETSAIEQKHIRTNSCDMRETVCISNSITNGTKTTASNSYGMEIDSANDLYVKNDLHCEEHSVESASYEELRSDSGIDRFSRINAKKQLNVDNDLKPISNLKKDNSTNNFFSRFNVSNKQKVNAPSSLSEQEYPLATLLMCKQLQTPVEYNLQFSRTNSENCTRSNSPCKDSVVNNLADVQISNEKAKSCSETISVSNNDECEVLCQYKIVNDHILLRDTNGSWITLTSDVASLKLPPLDVPEENQSITFQILYLSQDMCPKLSNLICGKVISFQKESGKLTINILPSFINSLVVDCGEDATLPEELIHIVDDAYEVSWSAVRNPRLLM